MEEVRPYFYWALLVVCCYGLALAPRPTAQGLAAIGEWQRSDAVNRRTAAPSIKKRHSLLQMQRRRRLVSRRQWHIYEAKNTATAHKRDGQRLEEDSKNGVQVDGTSG